MTNTDDIVFHVPDPVLETDIVPPPAPAPPLPPPFSARATVACIVALVVGLGVLVLMSVVVHREQRTAPWSDAMIVAAEYPPWDGMRPAWVRYLTVDEIPAPSPGLAELESALQATEDGRIVLEFLRPEKHERLTAVDMPVEQMQPLLESGRLPEPGTGEVLAGDLARWDAFTVDGVRFNVVGHIKRSASATVFSYLLPYDAAFSDVFAESAESKRAWLDIDGMERLQDASAEEVETTLPENAEIIGALVRTPTWVALSNIAGILLVILGGAGLHIVVFRRLARRQVPFVGAVFRESARWPRLFLAHHVVFLGLFVAVMLIGTLMPLANLRLMSVIQGIFVEGELKYVGDAYASGNIWNAALATFTNNYVYQTLFFTLGASLFIPFFGLLKNAASFALAGFGMAPMWTSTMAVMPVHSITIALELEAYVVACFAVTLWPVFLVLAARDRNLGHIGRGIALVAGTAVITCLLLAFAGLYEATTLILLRG